jgi:hypothetical protein
MSSTLLELMRHTYEQSERYEVAIGEELDIKPNGVRIFLFMCKMKSLSYSLPIVFFSCDFFFSKKRKCGNSTI